MIDWLLPEIGKQSPKTLLDVFERYIERYLTLEKLGFPEDYVPLRAVPEMVGSAQRRSPAPPPD